MGININRQDKLKFEDRFLVSYLSNSHV